ncbi:MAG: pyridoxamine 5'-phosphate oxidase [Gammaproteobacteria bacterium]|nr:pyridoxamine 5'-phosphate oxidase [Gammaproteobacteria bacterium]MCW9055098.1 pyridoxamine 5'-phosphate oxidase [Gammaproteobacteria bacterium]
MKTDDLRQQLMAQGLNHSQLDSNPYRQFEAWYAQTIETGVYEPGAMSLATVDEEGQPWQRTVLLKLFDEQGFVFFTNYESRKAKQMDANPKVSLLFPWHAMGRQLKMTGEVEKISTAESLKYFTTRPRGSQLGAWASNQSQIISSRSILVSMFDSMKQKYDNQEVPLPPFWGGYRVKPETFEFWQARDSRLHDRFIYRKNEAGEWFSERMAP